jgi:hypothetical protein
MDSVCGIVPLEFPTLLYDMQVRVATQTVFIRLRREQVVSCPSLEDTGCSVSIKTFTYAIFAQPQIVAALVAMVTTDSSVCTSRIRQACIHRVYFEVRLQAREIDVGESSDRLNCVTK